MTYRSAILSVFAALAVALSPTASAEEFFLETVPVDLDPSDLDREQFDGLIYRGGVEIRPGEAEIGGISGLEWHEGKLYAVMDDGRWLILTPDEIGGKLVDMIGAETGPLLDQRGKRLREKEEADAEGLTRSDTDGWLVSFEQDHRIWGYRDFASEATALPFTTEGMLAITEPNKGLEALARYPEGLLLCAEIAVPDEPNCMRVDGNGARSFAIAPPRQLAEHGGAPTDAACGSDGTCYVLFRSYRPEEGNRAAIVLLPPTGDPETIAILLPPLALDNFEGLAVREEPGRTYLYLASDNNFSGSQRTLVMKFEVIAAADDTALAPPPATEVDNTEYDTVNVVLETELGDITIALETERAPITAGNFLRYVDEDRFDGTAFYRTMRLDREPRPNGLIQGGTRWDPDRVLPGIQHEPTTQTGLSHTSGALSMAMGEPGTANGDFSIMLQDQTGLDAQPGSDDPVWKNGYAVFGYVIEGMDIVAAIHAAPTDPELGEGAMKGQMIAEPITIIDARRVEDPAK
ncbi:esterase-like activity of phytase family protein [Erythrobacter sp. GH1-10]|uniref:esterase-like activity of phytase family protein n=1 Tax=Erythrobacter sp. GH1-10 TaxID=3349334 RepID=UPI0038783138